MKRFQKLIIAAAALGCLGAAGAGFFFFWPHSLPDVSASALQPTGAALIARGEYLATAADCAACHTTEGGKPFAGGLPFKLPFGTIYSSNITTDPDHGIGAWSDAEFVRAVRSGVGVHGENLYPAFPYASYALMTTDDILAVRAYLRTLAPVSEDAPSNSLAFPFNQRWLMRGWNLLFLPSRPFENDPSKDEQWNRGAYLVEALEHCGECHTPRGLMFQRKQSEALSGSEVDGWKAWNITSDPDSGIGLWTNDEIGSLLSKGHANGHGPAGGAMREAVDLSLSKLPTSDIEAIVAYLRTVPPIESDEKVRVKRKNSIQNASFQNSDETLGSRIFAGACASCHGLGGDGLVNSRANIIGAHALADVDGSNFIRVVLQGSSDSMVAPGRTMPAFGAIYNDAEIAALANFVIGEIGEKKGAVTEEDVAKARE
ncbi:c-type cytochrome [Rhizobium leguminosarum]|uniref:c-type cytochrome n=1 Tax=Rhizobium leguminosarum TaxID=384 RepID=UPI001C973614|nr:cytochrome c [Rhizobium leguminosarum]MBY5353649.1 c-type cytochrome [Rhizobium leguminosarum]MBY5454085.1 c-type cytochrome [Rhizobium leguminosarum]